MSADELAELVLTMRTMQRRMTKKATNRELLALLEAQASVDAAVDRLLGDRVYVITELAMNAK